MLHISGNKCYINHSGKYIEINFNMKIPFFQIFIKNIKNVPKRKLRLG